MVFSTTMTREILLLTNERCESGRSQNDSPSTYVGHHYALYITALYIKLISGKTTLTYCISLTLYLLIDAKINRYSITLPCRNGKCSKSLRLMPINDLRYSFVKIIFVKNSILDFRKKSKIRWSPLTYLIVNNNKLKNNIFSFDKTKQSKDSIIVFSERNN